jgi:oligopeptide/dipeptide ABC transporter ATP-binding protein
VSSVSAAAKNVLLVDDVHMTYHSHGRVVHALQGVSLEVSQGEAVGLVGESGCGKSSLGRALIGLNSAALATIDSGRIVIDGRDVTHLSQDEWPEVRGNPVAMVFQDSLSFLNPVMRINEQVAESVRTHDRAADVNRRVRELLELVRLPPAVLRSYPFELSGGMRQRVAIAIALGCRPRLLIADEPTTALDVTTQAEIIALIDELRRSQGMALLLISHDLGVVRSVCDRVCIMYAGRIVEWGGTQEVFGSPGHPYVEGLLASAQTEREGRHFASIKGEVPNLSDEITACPFAPRCPKVFEPCNVMPDVFDAGGNHFHRVRCWLHAQGRRVDGERQNGTPAQPGR